MKTKIFLLSLLVVLFVACDKHDFRTEQITYYNSLHLPHSPSDSLVISIEIEYPVDMQDPEILHRIQTDLLSALLDTEIETVDAQKAVTDYAHNFENGYLEAFKSDENDSIGYDCWENSIIGRVMGMRNDILSYSDERFVFLGGRPHGTNTRHFYNYDITTGQYLTEKDLFKPDYENQLRQLLIDNLIAEYEEFESVEDINRSDFRLEDIRPNGNFYFTDDEMVYVFNPYEIAPYYIGETEISIPLEQVRDFLNRQL